MSGALAELARTRLEAVERFLESRGLTIDAVGEAVVGALGEPATILLTSSPVHGLANALSDIDTVCIVEGGEEVAGMATQLFAAGNHLEYVHFTRALLERDLDHLERVAALAPAAAVAAYHGWNTARTVRLKYLERIVNGIATDGTMPFADHLPDLATMWKWSSLERAIRLAALAIIAERAGESRGRLAYAANSTLYAMDAVLCDRDSVCGNRKWFLLRWDRFCRTRHGGEPPVAAIETARTALGRIPVEGAALAGTMVETVAELGQALGAPVGTLACAPPAGTRELALLPGGSMVVLSGGGAVPTADGSPAPAEASLAELAELDAAAAAALLRRLRAEALRLEVWP